MTRNRISLPIFVVVIAAAVALIAATSGSSAKKAQRAVAANKYASAMAAADVNQAAANMASFGATNWANAGTQKVQKFQKVSANLAAAISAVKATVSAMPRGKGANNQARMNAWFSGMGSYYGKIK